jgi:hypothetical protein
MSFKRVTFDPEGPLWETVSGDRYPTWSCAFCGGGFEETGGGCAVGWISIDNRLCCSEACARLRQKDGPPPPTANAWLHGFDD